MEKEQIEFIKNKEKWLNEVSDDCHEFALKTDLDFYVFQTSCENFKPDLLIIGINPGGNTSYKSMLLDKGYKKRPANDLGYNENTLIKKPDWEQDRGGDVLRNRLSRVFNDQNNLNILDNTVMMNMFFFNTVKANEIGLIEQAKQIKNYCIKKTIEFVEILQPKNILFLTSSDDNLKACSLKDIVKVENNVKRASMNGRIVFAIPHYGAYSAYSKENSGKMGKTLSKNFL